MAFHDEYGCNGTTSLDEFYISRHKLEVMVIFLDFFFFRNPISDFDNCHVRLPFDIGKLDRFVN